MTEKEITLLVENGIGYIHAEYLGGGDSGAIEQITYIANSCEKMQDGWNEDNLYISAHGYEEILRPKKLDQQIIENLAYKHLNTVEDWWNNDGGYGCLVIEVPSLKFKNLNVIEYRQSESYNHEGTFEKEEV
jgi:hypothetical protein